MQALLDITSIDPTMKQCQIQAVAKNVAWLKKYAPTEFGVAFHYGRVQFAMLDNCPVTVNKSSEGQFQKYVNNTGQCMVPPKYELGTLYEEAETLIHYSCFTAGKFMLFDLKETAL